MKNIDMIHMIHMIHFNPDELKFNVYNPKIHDLPKLDLTQTNGQDPLGAQEYFEQRILNKESQNNDSTYVISYFKSWVGFFSIDLAKIQVNKNNLLNETSLSSKEFPISLLIKKIGIDKNYRCYGIGKYILLFCTGLAQRINKNQQCRLVIFKTTRSLADKIYFPKYQFNYGDSDEEKKLVWVYKKIY